MIRSASDPSLKQVNWSSRWHENPLVNAWPELAMMEEYRCPESRCLAGCRRLWCLMDVIMHLNDGHEWTREQIADAVEEGVLHHHRV